MKSALCKNCGKPLHRGPCRIESNTTPVSSNVPAPAETVSPNIPKFDRNAYHRKYMRAYMARKRAAQKDPGRIS